MAPVWKHEKDIKAQIRAYFDAVDEVMGAFEKAIATYLQEGLSEDFAAGDRATHRLESHADDLRIAVEKTLYRKALLPESRDDLLDLLEAFDDIPNLAETILFHLLTQQLLMPPPLLPHFRSLVEVNMDAYRLVRQATEHLFAQPESMERAVAPVDRAESESDALERALVIEIFRSDFPKADMILLRDIVMKTSDISDAALLVARRLDILSLKRRT